MSYSEKCTWRNIYCMITGVYALLVFIRAFLPLSDKVQLIATNEDIPFSIGDEKINMSDVYQDQLDRVIIMVIDAFRVDFIDGLNGADNMPYIHSLLIKNKAFSLVANVQMPTVTMPRIKAMTTGTVPSFIDIMYNFGSNSIIEDNIIKQAENNGKSILFYGDETWIKLFPNNFKRKEGTTSFFVADFSEVDDNVTRNLDKELKVDDWKIMILHYLGLDHIGHLEGPSSVHVKPKLLEMDHIVQKIHHNMMKWAERSSQQSILIICGDHGMKDSGGHGGATIAETTVPIITVGGRQIFNISNQDKPVSQIDLVPTLSVLLGIPIPKGNIGKLIPQFIQNISLEKKLYAYYYNARQVVDHFKEMDFYHSKDAYLEYEEAVRLHMLWLKEDRQSEYYGVKSSELYISSLENMSEILGISKISQDILCIFISVCIELQISSNLLFQNIDIKCLRAHIGQFLSFTVMFSFFNVFYCLYIESESALCTLKLESFLCLMAPTVIIFAFNILKIINSNSSSLLLKIHKNQFLKWFVVGSALHLVSLVSSSFIEEEHQVWYFLWLTFIIVIMYNQCLQGYHRGCFKSPYIYSSLFFVICHRILRKLNQTGDKWASLPDISDWLLEPHNKGYLSLIHILGLLGNCVFLCIWQWRYTVQNSTLKILDVIINFTSIVTIYFYRAVTGAVIKLYDKDDSKGITEVRLLWCLLLVMTVKHIVMGIMSNIFVNRVSVIQEMMNLFLGIWILFINLLHRPHNGLLPVFQACASFFLGSLYRHSLKAREDTRWLAIAHYWLGMVFYFYQGNSNSLATIDVAAGYVGLQDYHPVIVGMFMLINTFSAPVLSLLLLVCQLLLEAKTRGMHWLLDHSDVAFHTLICYRLCTITFYLILMAFQRHHLFVWTVFSPKLLYESVHTVVQFLFIIFIYVILYAVDFLFPIITNKINKVV